MIRYLNNVRLETNFYKDETDLTRTATELVTLGIANEKIVEILVQKEGSYPKGEDMKGLLALPTLREMHNHLDKTYMPLGWRAITPVANLKERLALEANELTLLAPSTALRADTMIKHLLSYGVSHIRTHVNIDPYIGLTNFHGVKEALEKYKDYLTYEIVAFPQHGYFLENTPELMEQALQEGADLVGGLDPAGIDFAIEDSIAALVQLAQNYNRGIDIHLHDIGDVGIYTVETLLDELERCDFKYSIALSHAFCLKISEDKKRNELFERLSKANVHIMSTVPYDLRDRRPPIDQLTQAGVTVSFGSDGFFDSWSSFVSGDLVEKVKNFCEVTGKITEEEIARSYQYACGKPCPFSFDSKKYWFDEGELANILFVPASCTAEFVARRPLERKLLLRGKWIDVSDENRY